MKIKILPPPIFQFVFLFSKKAFFVFVFLISLQSLSFSQDNGCPNCSVPFSNEIGFPVYLDDYPGCEVTAYVRLRNCNGEHEFDFLYFEFFSSGDCDDFRNDFITNSINGTLSQWLAGYMPEVYRKASDYYFNQFLAQAPSGAYDCDNGPLAPLVTTSYTFGSCIGFCIGKELSTYSPLQISVFNCGIVCCKKKRTYCFDSTTSQVVVVESIVPVSMNCTNVVTPTTEICPSIRGVEWEFTTDCYEYSICD